MNLCWKTRDCILIFYLRRKIFRTLKLSNGCGIKYNILTYFSCSKNFAVITGFRLCNNKYLEREHKHV